MKRFHVVRNEKGSLSIDFQASCLFPFYFSCCFGKSWHPVTPVLSLKSAANDGAQMYAITGNYTEASGYR